MVEVLDPRCRVEMFVMSKLSFEVNLFIVFVELLASEMPNVSRT